MKKYAEKFYKGKIWQECRKAYVQSVGGLCEECRKAGIYKAGDTVHHIIHITPENIDNTDITLNWGNLVLLCRDCHAKIHGNGTSNNKRYKIGADGKVAPL